MASWIRITIMNLVGICSGKSNYNRNIKYTQDPKQYEATKQHDERPTNQRRYTKDIIDGFIYSGHYSWKGRI